MGADGHLNFDTRIDEKGFNGGISKLGGIAKGGLAVLGGAVAGVTAAMGAGVAAGVKYNAGIEQYQTSFEVMTGSADKAAEIIENLKKVGAETPFELKDLADTTQLLMNYGMTADDAQGKMMMLGDISQGSAEKMNRIATAYGQMSSAGKVQLEDIKQMIEAGFNPLQEISESTGESMESLYDRISKGAVSVDEITASMERSTAEGGKYYQSMEKQSQTVTGLVSTLKDNAQQLLGEVVKPISEGIAKDLLPTAIGAIEQLTSAFKEDGMEGLIEAGGQIIVSLLMGITQKAPDLLNIAIQLVSTLLTSLTEQMPQLMEAGMSILMTLLQGIATMLPQFSVLCYTMGQEFLNALLQNLPQILEMGTQMIVQLCQGIAQFLPTLIPLAVEVVLTLVQGLLDNLPQIIAAGLELLVALTQGIVNAIPKLVEAIPGVISSIISAIIQSLPQIIEAGVEILMALVNGLVSAIPQLVASIPQIITGIVEALLNSLPQIIESGIKIIGALIAGLVKAIPDIIGAIPQIVGSIFKAFGQVDWAELGINIIKGIANGLKGAAGTVIDAAKSVGKSMLGSIKGFLGIHSPSTVFRDQVGKYMAVGMGVGFEENIPVSDMDKSIHASVNHVKAALSGIEAEIPISTGMTNNLIANVGGGGNYRFKIPDNDSGFDPKQMGEVLAKSMERIGVYIDKKLVGKLLTPVINEEFGKIERRKT